MSINVEFSYDVNPKMKEFILKEIEARNIKKVDLDAVLVIIGQVKMYYQRIEEENQTNAFNEYGTYSCFFPLSIKAFSFMLFEKGFLSFKK